MLTNNIYALQKLVTDTVEHNKDIAYVFILNERGKVLVHSYGDYLPSVELINANTVDTNEDDHLLMISTDEGVIRDVAMPVVKGLGGTARIGLRSTYLDQALTSITIEMIITMFGVLTLTVFIVLILTRMIVAPIRKLVDLTKKVAQGDFTARILAYPNDEIGKLTDSFNVMIDNLANAEKEKEEYYKKVISRNRELTLLNSISANITTIEDMRMVLQRFMIDLVEELSINSAKIEVKFLDNLETFYYSNSECPQDEFSENRSMLLCTCDKKVQKNIDVFPLIVKDDKIGEIRICSNLELDKYSLQILTSIVNQLSVTIENIQLWFEVKQKEKVRLMLLEKIMTVQEEERKRIARELHDETSHSISSILLGLKVLQETNTEDLRKKEIDRLRELVHHTLEEVHQLAWQLRPAILDKFGLKVALESYIDEFRKKYTVEFDVIINGIEDDRLRPDIETAIFRIVQESLTNILKYSKAKSISVIIMKNNYMISVIIEDDGVGFNVEEILNKDPSKYNLGIRGMQERATLLSGTFDIESKFNEGTTIMVKIPFRNGGE
jgi:signal transduction histidine kinase